MEHTGLKPEQMQDANITEGSLTIYTTSAPPLPHVSLSNII